MTRMLLPARRRQRSCGTASKAESIVPVSVCPFVCLSLAATARRRTRKAYNVGLVSACLSVRPSGPRQRRTYRHRCGVRLLVCLSRRDADSAAAARRRTLAAYKHRPGVRLSVCPAQLRHGVEGACVDEVDAIVVEVEDPQVIESFQCTPLDLLDPVTCQPTSVIRDPIY